LVEVLEFNVSRPVLVEEAEDDLVLGIWFREEVLEDAPVCQTDSSGTGAVCNEEQNPILVSLDFVLRV